MKNIVILALLIMISTPIPGGHVWAQDPDTISTKMGENVGKNTVESGPLLPRQTFSPLVETGRETVNVAVDGIRLMLNNGQVVELAGIDIPGMNSPKDPGDFPLQAKAALDQIFATDKDIILYQTRDKDMGRTNRMGHILAHIVQKPGNIWMQAYLVRQGLARVAPTPRNPEMAAQLYAIEQTARENKVGMWAEDTGFGIYPTSAPIDAREQFIIAQGTVAKAAIVNNRVYLNFGDNWRTDFSVGIDPDVRRAMAKTGIDSLQLQGKEIRIRGWVREYNGPFVDLETPAQIELMDGSKPLPVPGGGFTVSTPEKQNTDNAPHGGIKQHQSPK